MSSNKGQGDAKPREKRRRIKQETYDALVEAYRKVGANHAAASREVGCHRNTARKAWSKGWPEHDLDPIAHVIEVEQIQARAELESEEAQQRAELEQRIAEGDALAKEQARRDAIKARAEEGRLVRGTRVNVIALVENSRELLEGYKTLAPKVKRILADMDEGEIDVERAANILWRIATSARAASNAAMTVLQAERLLLGQPTEIVGVKDADDMDEDEALRELEQAAAAAERHRKRKLRKGDLTVYQGGKGQGETG